jgi:hypothetical protein
MRSCFGDGCLDSSLVLLHNVRSGGAARPAGLLFRIPPAADAAMRAMHTEQPVDRRIAGTLAISAVAHVALLLVFREPLGDPTAANLIPELRLEMSTEDGSDTQSEAPPELRNAARSVSPESVIGAASEQRIEEREAVPEAMSPPMPASATAIDSSESLEAYEAAAVANNLDAAPIAEPSDLITTTGDSTHTVSRNETPSLDELADASDVRDLALQTPAAFAAVPAPTPPTAAQRKVLERGVARFTRDITHAEITPQQRTWTVGGERYTAVVTREPASSNMDLDRAIVEITAERAGKKYRTRMQLKRLAFSHFTQLVDESEAAVHFHDDVVVGRFHSNGEMQLAIDRETAPKFAGLVTTAANNIRTTATGFYRRRDIFEQGIQMRRSRIELRRSAMDRNLIADNAANHVQTFAEDARITFLPDSSYTWAKADGSGPVQRVATNGRVTYLVATGQAALHVSGVVRGAVLLYSPELIVIERNLVYANEPHRSADTSDFLGLVSDRDVKIAEPEVTGPGDIAIHAAIYARNRFEVKRERSRPSGVLKIYGSLSAGTVSATEPRYATKIEFDPRLEQRRPPGFPVTDRYEVETWDREWQRIETEETVQ